MTLGSEHFRDKRKITKEIATESWSHSPEETALRLKNFERFEAMTPEEFDVAAEGSNLSEGEKEYLAVWREFMPVLLQSDRRERVINMMYSAKHPTLTSLFGIPDSVTDKMSPKEEEMYKQLGEREWNLRPHELNSALIKMQRYYEKLDGNESTAELKETIEAPCTKCSTKMMFTLNEDNMYVIPEHTRSDVTNVPIPQIVTRRCDGSGRVVDPDLMSYMKRE